MMKKDQTIAASFPALRTIRPAMIGTVQGPANRFVVSALSLALMSVFSPAHADSSPTTVTSNAGDDTSLTAGETYARVSAGSATQAGGSISGSGVTVSGNVPGSFDGAVEAFGGGQISLDSSNVSNSWTDAPGADAGSSGVSSRGTGSLVSLTNTNVAMSSPTATDGGASAAIQATASGHVKITGGQLNADGFAVRGIIANGGGETASLFGGEDVDATGVTIVTDGARGIGAEAFGTGDPDRPQSTIELNGGSITTTSATYAPAVASWLQGALVTIDGTDLKTAASLSNSGELPDTVDVQVGGKVSMKDGSILATGDNARAISVDGAGSEMDVTGSTQITAQGALAHAVSATDGGTIKLTGSTVSATNPGTDTMGLYANGEGSSITAVDTGIAVAGTGTNGGTAPVGASADTGGVISLTAGTVAMTGTERTIGLRTTDGGTITASGTAISTSGNDSHAVMAYETSSASTSQITIDNGSVTTSGTNSYGLYGDNTGATVNDNGVIVSTTGNVGRGVYALNGGIVNVDGGSIETGGDNAEGMLSSGPANSLITASGATVTTHGAQSSGIAAGFFDGLAGSIDFTGGSIATTGSQSAGVFSQLGGTASLHDTSVTASGANAPAASVASGGTLNVDGSTLTSTQSAGLVLTDNATVTLTGTTVASAGPSIASTLDTAGQTQNVTVGAGSVLTQNNGTLLQVSRTADGMDGTVNLTLQAGAVASGNIVDTDGLTGGAGTRAQGGRTNFVMDPGASWTGTTSGLNSTSIGDGSSFTDNGGAPISGDVTGGNNAQVTFNDQATIGGSVQAGANSTVSFNDATTIGQDVMSSGASFTFAQAATIGRDVAATAGGSVAFSGAATIAGDVSATNSTLAFSNAASTVIGGNVTLDNGSSMRGGTVSSPVTVAGDAVVNGSTFGGNVNVQGTLSGTNGILAPGSGTDGESSASVSNAAQSGPAAIRAAAQPAQSAAANALGIQTFGRIAGFSGTYAAEVNSAGQSDEVIVHGDADLSGIALTVGQENGNGGYRINTPYTVLATTGGGTVQGEFASAGLDASMANTLVDLAPVDYGSTAVKVQFSLDPQKIAAARSGLTRNQNAVLSGAMAVAGTNAAAATLFTANIDRAAALNQLSGDGYASIASALVQDSHYIRDAAEDRVRSLFGGAGAAVPVTTYGTNVWTKGFGSWGQTGGTADAGRLSDSTGGFLIGVDGMVAPNWRAGVLGGFSHSNFDVDSRSFSAKSDNYHLGVYGGTQSGNLGFRAGAAYTWSNVDANRSVAFPGFADNPSAGYDAGTAQVFGEFGYQLHLDTVGIEPFANVAYVNLHADGFTEAGGDAALTLQADNINTAFSTLGLHASSDFSIGRADLTARGTVGWQHAYGRVTTMSSAAFAGGQGFAVAGVPVVRDAAVIEVGLNASIARNTSLGISYSGQLGNHTQDNGFAANLNYRF